MGKINWVRVFCGGLLAGVIINAVEMVFHWAILGANWWFFKALGHPIEKAAEIIRYAGLHFLVGIAAIWLYAAARPRFGPGPRTAAYIGFAYWVIGYALPTASFLPLVLVVVPGMRGWVIGTLVGLLGIVAATIAGAWLYKE